MKSDKTHSLTITLSFNWCKLMMFMQHESYTFFHFTSSRFLLEEPLSQSDGSTPFFNQLRYRNLFELLPSTYPVRSNDFFLVWCRPQRLKLCHVHWCYLDQKIAMIKANNNPISKGWRCSGTRFSDATRTTIETNLLGVSDLRDATMHFIWFDQDMGILVQSGLNFTSQNRHS